MHWHVKPTIEKKPENIIVHCGTNDISKDADLEKIAADIINLSESVCEKVTCFVRNFLKTEFNIEEV